MIVFNVYPKEGNIFTLICKRFEFNEQRFVLFDYGNKPSDDSYLSPENVAAIAPQTLPETPSRFSDVRNYQIHLKNRKEPIKIAAHSFDLNHTSGVKFYWHMVDAETGNLKNAEVANIYVSLSEVVAIVPDGGVPYKE